MSRAAVLAAILLVLSGCGGGGDPGPKPTAASVATDTEAKQTPDAKPKPDAKPRPGAKPKPAGGPSWIPRDLRKFIGGEPQYRRGCRNIEINPPQPNYAGAYSIWGSSRAACGRAIRLTLALDREVRIRASNCDPSSFCANPTAIYVVDGASCSVMREGEGSIMVVRCNRNGRQLVRMDLD